MANSEQPKDRVLLGHISAAHGIRGEVIIKSYCDVPEDIAAYGPLENETGDRTFKFTIRGATKRGLIARVEGVSDRNAAELLRGTKLFVARERLPETEDDEFYHADLIGLAVKNPAGEILGRVVAIQNFGAGDLLEVKMPGARTTEFFPFEERFVPEINVDAGTITIAIDEPGDVDPNDGDGDDVAAPDRGPTHD